MQIDRTNYGVYFLDYIDGTLAVDLIDEFLGFLESNPDLKEELLAVSQNPVRLTGENIIFEGKKDLLKNELTGSSDFDYRAIACMEGDLTEKEKALFYQELQKNTQKQTDFDLIKSLRIKPRLDIVFPGKDKLLKKQKKAGLWIWAGPVAAVLTLVFLIRMLSPTDQVETLSSQKTPVVARNTPPKGKLEKPLPSDEKQQPPVNLSKGAATMTAVSKQVVSGQSIHTILPGTEEAPVPALKEEPMKTLQPISIEAIPVQTEKISRLPKAGGEQRNEIQYTKLTDYLAQKLLDVPKGEPVTLASIARVGLEAAENISNRKLSIEKTKEGRIEEINFNSMLFGFSIPVKKNK